MKNQIIIFLLFLSLIPVVRSEGKDKSNFIELSGNNILIPLSNENSLVCPTYKRYEKTVITSSKDGELSNSGWVGVKTWSTCAPTDTGITGPVCTYKIIPGVSLGDKDITITTCITAKVVCIANCLCKVTVKPVKKSMALPQIDLAIGGINKLKSKIPLIQNINITVNGNVTGEIGQECCLPNPFALPVTYTKVSGSTSTSVNVGLKLPNINIPLSLSVQGIFKLNCSLSLVPNAATIKAKGTASASGKFYTPAVCPACYTVSLSFSGGSHVSYTATGKCSVSLPKWNKFFAVGITGTMDTKSSVNGSASWSSAGCPAPGLKASLSMSKMQGAATAAVVILGKKYIIFKQTLLIYSGMSVSF